MQSKSMILKRYKLCKQPYVNAKELRIVLSCSYQKAYEIFNKYKSIAGCPLSKSKVDLEEICKAAGIDLNEIIHKVENMKEKIGGKNED